MLKRFLEYGEKQRLFSKNSHLLIAVSGGIDSMVMAWLFREAGLDHSIAHCNFSLRGEESDGDEQFVASWAYQNNIPFYSNRFDTLGYASAHRISVQMAARELRYTWFRSLAAREGFDGVAVAHNLNDNVETFLINLTRGTGLSGLTGMSPRTTDIIRPLLFATRAELSAFAEENKIDFREDSSNSQVKYTRNRIRHRVIPEMERVNPGLLSAVTDTMHHLSASSEILENCVSKVTGELFRLSNEKAEADIMSLLALRPFKPLIYALFRQWGGNPRQTEEIVSLLHSTTGKFLYTSTHRVLNDRGKIIITPRAQEPEGDYHFSTVDEIHISGLFSDLSINEPSDEPLPISPLTACLDLDLVNFPVTVRHWEPGDRFMPLGMKQMKKISDFLIDLKVPVTDKEKVLLLMSGEDVMWVMGYRIDDRFRVTSDTARILRLSL